VILGGKKGIETPAVYYCIHPWLLGLFPFRSGEPFLRAKGFSKITIKILPIEISGYILRVWCYVTPWELIEH
jgi:hypothetical protein